MKGRSEVAIFHRDILGQAGILGGRMEETTTTTLIRSQVRKILLSVLIFVPPSSVVVGGEPYKVEIIQELLSSNDSQDACAGLLELITKGTGTPQLNGLAKKSLAALPCKDRIRVLSHLLDGTSSASIFSDEIRGFSNSDFDLSCDTNEVLAPRNPVSSVVAPEDQPESVHSANSKILSLLLMTLISPDREEVWKGLKDGVVTYFWRNKRAIATYLKYLPLSTNSVQILSQLALEPQEVIRANALWSLAFQLRHEMASSKPDVELLKESIAKLTDLQIGRGISRAGQFDIPENPTVAIEKIKADGKMFLETTNKKTSTNPSRQDSPPLQSRHVIPPSPDPSSAP